MSIRIVIADDHEVVRAGLRAIMSGTDIQIVGEAASGEEAVRLAMHENPAVVLLDIRLAREDGLNALSR
jgi:DNA-binding NarL/FixJ family response regulator